VQVTDKVDRWHTSEQKHRRLTSTLPMIKLRPRGIKGFRHLPLLQAALQEEFVRSETRECIVDA
jgi:putative transposase